MTRWEYFVTNNASPAYLERLGWAGWELVGVAGEGSVKRPWRLFFKRPIERGES